MNNELYLQGIVLLFGSNFDDFCDSGFLYYWGHLEPVVIRGCFLHIRSCQKSDPQRKKVHFVLTIKFLCGFTVLWL